MPLVEYAVTDNATYEKHRQEIDEIILKALASGPKTSIELTNLLRIAGFGNARNDGPLELSYSMTGAVYRSAKNSLRSRGMICDSWDIYTETGAKVPPLEIMLRPRPTLAAEQTSQEPANAG